MAQKEMFTAGEDLPLFSGTPQTVTLPQPQPSRRSQTKGFTFQCGTCCDTGVLQVDGKQVFCICETGQTVKKDAQKGATLD